MPIVGIERAFNDPAVGLRCIDHCPLAAAYCNVTVINDYISAFDVVDIVVALIAGAAAPHVTRHVARSEERRVGKECRSRWSPYH